MRALAFLLFAALGAPAWADPFAVRLGRERVVLAAPAGFSDTLDLASPRLRELAESLTSASNRILLFALTDGDLRRFSLGDAPALHRYLLVATPRALERDSLSLSRFGALTADSVRGLGDPAASAAITARLDAQPVGRATLLRELGRSPLARSLLAGTRLPASGDAAPRYLLFTTTYLLLRGKALIVSVYSIYAGPADLDWLVQQTRRWTDELSSLNSSR